MKKLFLSALSVLLLGSGWANAGGIEVDFTQSDVLKKNLPLQLRGKAVLSAKGLTTVGTVDSSDAVTSRKILKETAPEGAFTFEAEFTLDPAPAKATYRYVFDNKYITMPNAKQEKFHKGFSVVLRSWGKDFRIYAAFGFGNKSFEVASNPVPIKVGKKHRIELDFTSTGMVTFYLDGKIINRATMPEGSVALPGNLTAFGNRIGSSYQPLNGTLHKVVISGLKDRSVAPGTVLANWDFSKPETYKNMTVRGKDTKIADGAVTILGEGFETSNGISTKEIDASNTPSRAFELEAVFALSSKFKRYKNSPSMIIDSKYVARPGNAARDLPRHTGFMLNINPRGNNKYRFAAAFGFGKTSAEVFSKEFTLELDKFYTVKMLFNAAGKVTFMLDGNVVGECSVPAGSLAPATIPTTVGDRQGSNYYPFGGSIKSVVIKEAEYIPVSVTPSAMHRQVFERGETPVAVVDLRNASMMPLKDVEVEMNIAGLVSEKKKLM